MNVSIFKPVCYNLLDIDNADFIPCMYGVLVCASTKQEGEIAEHPALGNSQRKMGRVTGYTFTSVAGVIQGPGIQL